MPGRISVDRITLLLAGVLVLASCGSKQNINDFGLREVTTPNGSIVRVEALIDPTLMARGAMFRDSMPPDRGLLYQYAKPGFYSFWMYRTTFPLDTIWMDRNRNVVELVENMQPCPSKSARDCPHYGGRESAFYVMQVAGGQASKLGVRVGSALNF